RSGDQGLHFEKRRKGGIIGGGPPFKAICFKNRDEGLIGGEDGLLLRTEDGGKDWIQLEGLPAFNIQDISFDGKKYWLCGSGGRILSLLL
ncbi:MAG TPA: hypothetical protein VFX48_08985, partial [Saprospiraceae bacterium]|nr:hypothetical protein [Saprospiraceae bacterium]